MTLLYPQLSHEFLNILLKIVQIPLHTGYHNKNGTILHDDVFIYSNFMPNSSVLLSL